MYLRDVHVERGAIEEVVVWSDIFKKVAGKSEGYRGALLHNSAHLPCCEEVHPSASTRRLWAVFFFLILFICSRASGNDVQWNGKI